MIILQVVKDPRVLSQGNNGLIRGMIILQTTLATVLKNYLLLPSQETSQLFIQTIYRQTAQCSMKHFSTLVLTHKAHINNNRHLSKLQCAKCVKTFNDSWYLHLAVEYHFLVPGVAQQLGCGLQLILKRRCWVLTGTKCKVHCIHLSNVDMGSIKV